MPFLIGFGTAAIISYAAHRAHSLDRSGALAATLVGTIVLGAGGWPWAVLLLVFFVSSSLLTRAFQGRKRNLTLNYAKGGSRDAGQVLGNGALATLFAGLNYLLPHEPWIWIGFATALAAVNADTWATELGVLSPVRPRLITNLRPVEKGTSGGISAWGTLAALAGAALIALPAWVLIPPALGLPAFGLAWSLILPVTAAGLLGSLFDSFLGATAQAMYFCPTCQKDTERHPLHSCGTPTVLVRGWGWLGNDWVNLGCGLFAVLVGLLFAGA
jgi:uncharacterized protein (TIGR00297 family)